MAHKNVCGHSTSVTNYYINVIEKRLLSLCEIVYNVPPDKYPSDNECVNRVWGVARFFNGLLTG